MIRSAFLRPHSRALGTWTIAARSASSLARALQEADEELVQELGAVYGAGPSQQPLHDAETQSYDRVDIADAGRSSADARYLRTVLRSVINERCTYSTLQRALLVAGLPPVESLGRIDLHILLHTLLRRTPDRPITRQVLRRAVMRPGPRHPRGLVHPKTLAAIFPIEPPLPKEVPAETSTLASSDEASFAEFAAKPPSRLLRNLLHTLDRLQHSRHPRPLEVYYSVVEHCLAEKQYAIAAKVYVGLVEEWVTEGRVASGADPSDFYAGGGPPRDRETRERKSPLLKMWWRDVRSWALPGEVLSPHDRLDLWHPHNLSLREKLIRFPVPVPCSPPKLVPPPGPYLLAQILETLELDPDKATPADFAASMRACAMLASLVLSRTIPAIACNVLIDRLSKSPLWPAIYPESFTAPPPEDDAWAYQASTHVHLALTSLLWRVPFSPVPFPRPIGVVSGAHLYMTSSLNLRGCMVLLRYAYDRLRYPEGLAKLMPYINSSFGRFALSMSNVHNVVMAGSAKLGLRWLTDKSMGVLFKRTSLSEERLLARALRHGERGVGKWEVPKFNDPAVQSAKKSGEEYAEFRFRRPIPLDDDRDGASSLSLRIAQAIVPGEEVKIEPNEASIVALFDSLAATGQFYRMRQTIYRLLPFLGFAKWMNEDLVKTLLELHDAKPGWSGRPTARALSPEVYSAILRGIEKAAVETTSNWAILGHRIFLLALKAERQAAAIYRKTVDDPTARVPPALRRRRDDFETMLKIWGLHTVYRLNGTKWPIPIYRLMNKPAEPEDMIWAVYVEARHRVTKGDFEFGTEIFDLVMKGMSVRWGLNEPGVLVGKDHVRQRNRLKTLLSDMEQCGLPLRVNWVRKLMDVPEENVEPWGLMQAEPISWPLPGQGKEQLPPLVAGVISDDRLALLMRLEMGHGWKVKEAERKRKTERQDMVSSA